MLDSFQTLVRGELNELFLPSFLLANLIVKDPDGDKVLVTSEIFIKMALLYVAIKTPPQDTK